MIDNTSKTITPFSYNSYNENWTVLDALYGPWNSFREAILKVTKRKNITDEGVESFLKSLPVGLTVGIYENDKVVEYWNPVEGQGFVKKMSEDESVVNKLITAKTDIIEQTIEENEEVTAAALNDINTRLNNITHPITGVNDDSVDLLEVDESKLSAIIGDLFAIDALMDNSDDSDNPDFNNALGLCEAGNVYAYIEQIKNELIAMMSAKKTGYFKAGPTISGSTAITDKLTVTSTPVTGGTVTYNWYVSDTENGDGTLISGANGSTYTITKNEYGKYIYVVASFEENEEYTACEKKSNVMGVVTLKLATLSFNPSTINRVYDVENVSAFSFDITPTTNKSTTDGSTLTLSELSDTSDVVTINSSSSISINKQSGTELPVLGTATIKAAISGSDTYNYNDSNAKLTINVSSSKHYYYGLCDANLEDNITDGKMTLPSGYKYTDSKTFSLTPSTGDSTIYDTFNSWYVLVPQNTSITIKEGDSDVTAKNKKSGVAYTDVFGNVYDVYYNVSPLSAIQGAWVRNVTIQ